MHLRIAEEVHGLLIAGMLLAVVGYFLHPAAGFLFLALTVFTAWFFRQPVLAVEADPAAVYGPAWGTVTSVRDADTGPGEPPERIVSIFLSIFDVHFQCAPVAAAVEAVDYTPGKFLNAMKEDSSAANERNRVRFRLPRTEERIDVVQIAGLIARRIVCRVKPGSSVRAGEYYGLIRFGSRVDVRMPARFEIRVNPGDRVRGPKTVLATIPQPFEAE
jgi:phosphatidylserine decarboxylase